MGRVLRRERSRAAAPRNGASGQTCPGGWLAGAPDRGGTSHLPGRRSPASASACRPPATHAVVRPRRFPTFVAFGQRRAALTDFAGGLLTSWGSEIPTRAIPAGAK